MPMGVVARSQNYQSRLWVEGTVVNGDPLRFVQNVPSVYSHSVWEQFPHGANDSLRFNNLIIQPGTFDFLMLVVGSAVASTEVDVNTNGGAPFIDGLDLTQPITGMREIRAQFTTAQSALTLNIINRSGGFLAGVYLSINRVNT